VVAGSYLERARRPLAGGAFVAWLIAAALSTSCQSGNASPTATATPLPATAGRFEVTLPGSGISLGGVLYRPEIPSGTRGAILVLHGWATAGTNGASLVENRARRYSEDGYVALALSMRGWPPSRGADDCGLQQPDDMVQAVAWLGALPGVDPGKVALVGFSQGGQVSLLAGARGASVKAIVAYYPVTDVARWQTTTTNPDIPGYVRAVCEPGGVAPRSPLSNAAALATPAVLLVHGDLDTRVPTEQSLLMHDALAGLGRQTSLLLVPGAQHGFTAEQEAVARPVVDEFLARWLK
jgi:dipeptidyl aminopeptidase/acylaminoacyl peptidase